LPFNNIRSSVAGEAFLGNNLLKSLCFGDKYGNVQEVVPFPFMISKSNPEEGKETGIYRGIGGEGRELCKKKGRFFCTTNV
jgi:hypothetical protein